MKIYTGQFKNVETYIENYLAVCSVAQYNPPWFKGITFKTLAPQKELLHEYKQNDISFGQFAKQYLNYLETVDFKLFFRVMDDLSDEYSGVVLCCYEDKTQFCHRHLLANYLNNHYQLGITEFYLG